MDERFTLGEVTQHVRAAADVLWREAVRAGFRPGAPKDTLVVYRVVGEVWQKIWDDDAVRRLHRMYAEGLVGAKRIRRDDGGEVTVQSLLTPQSTLLYGVFAAILKRSAYSGGLDYAAQRVATLIHAEVFAENVTETHIGAVLNFSAPPGVVFEVAQGVRIREVGEEDLDILAGPLPGPGDLSAWELNDLRWVVEISIQSSRDTSPTISGSQLARRVHTILRLYKGGNVVISGLAWEGLNGTSRSLDAIARPLFGTTYEVSENEVSDMEAFFATYWGILGRQTTGPLAIALHRFVDAPRDRRLEEQIIDYAIALEAALLPGIKGENRYRLAMRGAFLAASSDTERLILFEELRGIYDARSDVVHGEVPKWSRYDLTDSRIDEICRQVLRRALAVADSVTDDYQAAMNRLDRAMLLGVEPADVARTLVSK